MSFRVTVQPSGHEFTSNIGETILDAAERQGVGLPYGCRNGLCGSCAGDLLSGEVEYSDEQVKEAIEARPNKNCLPCQAAPVSDITIQIHEVQTEKELEVHSLLCEVGKVESLTHDVMRVYLNLPDDQRLQFLAGQYLDFILPDGRRRAFSIANAPHNDSQIELHIRHVPGGEFTDYVFSELQAGVTRQIQAPFGGFYLRETSDRPIMMMAGGTGFAPLKGILEHAFHTGVKHPIHLYWGVRAQRDIYLQELLDEWAAEYDNFRYTLVLSEPDSGWQGRTGWVHEAVVADYPDMSSFDLYMSGPPPMVYAAKDAFSSVGLPGEHMFSDVFEWAKDNPDK
ncbi:MAG: CDP-6-deoxy-delta-3,4-glucoseen reductase [Gammaproteobacteria bacterium]|nr:CDP-6-deoxy-delta-3,4-glucoseen reductase [Gammaproteobacteria bacterium]